jgi:hypothetical protein
MYSPHHSFASKVLSFTPGFSPVFSKVSVLKTVSTVSIVGKPENR